MDIPKRWLEVLGDIQCIFPEAVIAGGCLRDLLNGKQPKDIDVFVDANTISGFEASKHINFLFGLKTSTIINEAFTDYQSAAFDGVRYAIEFIPDDCLPVQIIGLRQSNLTPLSVVERIDFGICRVAHDGHQLLLHPDFIHDAHHKVFTLRSNTDPERMVRSLQRYNRLTADKYAGWPLVA